LREILYLGDHSPFKSQSGAHQRSNLICRALSKFSHVDVLTIEQDCNCNIENCSKVETNDLPVKNQKSDLINFLILFVPPVFFILVKIVKRLAVGILGTKKKHLSRIVKKLQSSKNYDFIFVRYINNIISFGIKPEKKVILDIDDLPEQYFQSKMLYLKNTASIKYFFAKIFYSILIKIIRYNTKKIIQNVLIAYVSNKEHCLLFKNTVYLPNIPFVFNEIDAINKSKHQIMFVGFIEYQPNYLGLVHFLNNVYPAIIKNVPDVNFNIVGKISEKRKSEWLYKYKNIKIAGFIDNLRNEYDNSSVIVVPVYSGSGTNIKVIEAMSIGKACVISSFAGRGFEDILENGKNILIAGNDNDFAEMTIKMLEDKNYRENIEISAKESVNKHYSFDNFSEIINCSIQNMAKVI